MPKGHNADGSKKIRPANSGRKRKAGQKIHSKLALDVIQILAFQSNPIQFLENAIREKAARSSSHKTQSEPTATSSHRVNQIDLMDMLAEIQSEQHNR